MEPLIEQFVQLVNSNVTVNNTSNTITNNNNNKGNWSDKSGILSMLCCDQNTDNLDYLISIFQGISYFIRKAKKVNKTKFLNK